MSLSAMPLRRLSGMLSVLMLAVIGLVALPVSAFAATPAYPAPAVDPAVQAGGPAASPRASKVALMAGMMPRDRRLLTHGPGWQTASS